MLVLDVEQHPQTARRYDVSTLPTLLIFRTGQLAGRIVGARSKERLLLDLVDYVG